MAKKEGKKEKKVDDRFVYVLYAIVLALIVLYVFYNNIIIGALAFLAIIITVLYEFKSSIKSEGFRKTVIDLAVALVLVVLIIWVLPSFVLQSSSPTDVVASCSMLPALGRGDLVLVHGISNFTSFVQQEHIPVVNVSTAQFNRTIGNITNEFLEPYAYTDNNTSHLVLNPYINSSIGSYKVALYGVNCVAFYFNHSDYLLFPRCLVNSTNQGSNLVTYSSGIANVTVNGAMDTIPVTSQIGIAGVPIVENYSNPVIVYRTIPADSFYAEAEIIHRVYAAMRVGNTYYFLTKGDNNPVLDMQAENYPVSQADVVGYLYASVPYLGYPSLIIKGQLAPVQQCSQVIDH